MNIVDPPTEGVNTTRPSVCPTCGRITDEPASLVSTSAGSMATYVDRFAHQWTVSWLGDA